MMDAFMKRLAVIRILEQLLEIFGMLRVEATIAEFLKRHLASQMIKADLKQVKDRIKSEHTEIESTRALEMT